MTHWLTEIFWLVYELPAIPRAMYVAAAAGFLMAYFLRKARRNYMLLPDLAAAGEPGAPPDVTVVIPARDEEKNIARCVRSFTPLGVRVLVVDDASGDATPYEAADAGAEVIPAPPLPKGFLGKPNACQAGADLAQTKWVLFADADTWYHPRFLPSIVRYAEENALTLVSCFPRQHTVTLAERIVLPYAFALYFCGVSAEGVNSPAASESLANGQCMLFKRDAYQFIGGHRAIASSVIEDMALAMRVKRHRMKAMVMRAENLARVRMYDSWGAILRGFRKNSFRFLLTNPATGFQIVLASIVLTSYLPVLAYLLWQEHWWGAFAFGVLPPYLLAPWYGGVLPALWSPLAIYAFQRIAIDSMLATSLGRKTRWKGREV